MNANLPQVAPYGSWPSPVSAETLTSDTVTLNDARIDGSDVYWLEGRPADEGRVVVVRRTADGTVSDVTAAPFNVRSRVHEYGGGGFDVAGGVLVFCNYSDRRVYRVDLGAGAGPSAPEPITPEGALRYGDLSIVSNGTAVLAVCEDHRDTTAEPRNRLVRLDLAGGNDDGGQVLVQDSDFVSSAALSPDGTRLAWLQWDHPNMPWDDCELWVAELARDGQPVEGRVVAGGPGESATQPRWAPDGRLVFISDRTGWWNLYALDVAGSAGPEHLWPAEHEFGDPGWVLATSSYGITGDGTLVCTWIDDGYARIGTLDLGTAARAEVTSDVTAVYGLRVEGGSAALVVAYADRPMAVVRLDVDAGALETLREASLRRIDPALVSVPEPVSWRGLDGEDVHGFYCAPRNPGFVGVDGERPPLVVQSHGGPTGMSKPIFEIGLQYWTTRGIGVLIVNYRGSSGYGRAYRDRLRGAWGVVDVDDCVSGAVAMASTGKADPRRLAIRGGSAGGYTTLAALTFRDVFTAGASLFGIGDLEMLARDTHKFESRYLDRLIGPYPEARDLYRERSPIHHVDRISCPMILLQGREDPVVPLNQAESMATAVRAKGLPIALIVFDGEGHGFRRGENVIRAKEAETYFYSRVFGFDLADDVQPVEIENLASSA